MAGTCTPDADMTWEWDGFTCDNTHRRTKYNPAGVFPDFFRPRVVAKRTEALGVVVRVLVAVVAVEGEAVAWRVCGEAVPPNAT